MKERPILFSGPMVRALLDGSKTQTRRVCKPALALSEVVGIQDPRDFGQSPLHIPGSGWFGDAEGDVQFACPYGKPGDQLWVRETWYCDDYRVQRGPYLKPDDMNMEAARADGTMVYRASCGDRPYEAEQPVWRPAIHMPRWASRILLEVVSVRVERLQDISEADARAEGARECDPVSGREVLLAGPSQRGSYVLHYRDIWEQINGPSSWALNPWVWAVEFKRINHV